MRVAPLERSQLVEAELVLADACAFDRATEVAEETLFGPGPTAPALAYGAWQDNELVGVAAISSKWLRVLAVVPHARRKGAGSALLAACEAAARGAGETKLRTLDQPGNYLAPGIDERNDYAIGWLERRGYVRNAEPRNNVLIDVRTNPRVSTERAAELVRAAAAKGYVVRRARHDETALLDAVAKEFGGAWPFELASALAYDPPAVHVAVLADRMATVGSTSSSATAGSTAAGSTTAGSTTTGSTTAGPTTAGSTTAGSTTTGSATAGSATAGSTTAGSTTAGSTTAGSTTAGSTTAGSTTAGSTTAGSTTAGPTTAGSTTTGSATAGSTTAGPTTAGPTTAGSTTAGSTTSGSTTSGSTAGSTTAGSTTAGSTTETYCAFAAHDGNNRGLGWFGPTGTWPAHRGKGLGEAVLMACLVDVGTEHARCEVAWIGPRPFYEKVAGIVEDRRFVLLVRDL